ncbi:MAG: zinc ribbon domain-containing protein [Methylotenera sp.]|uniref:FmdB family zinc ribbon protein n=1 Tax=Methylotenera sp. TaxID=2051956 RepID=UPI002726C7D6|nr:zinc ribbon domain-containing protein [Methylotenera sp.]MDO9394159.1 zinc ribbon domain-containing protein [Methylotenera sp.]
MPIYDYQCTSCGHKAEVMRKISAASTEACPQCGAEAFSKQLSAPSFQLSGSGWYATDFKNGGNKAPSSKTESSGSESSVEKKSETVASPAACASGCACH